MIRIERGLSALAEDYDAFIVDLWGVLHDGVRAFPAAVACLETLHDRGKRIVILSNAPRRAAVVAARNAELGIAARLCDAVVSSGEDTWQHLHGRPDAWYRALGRRRPFDAYSLHHPYFYSVDSIRQLMKLAGYEIVSLKTWLPGQVFHVDSRLVGTALQGALWVADAVAKKGHVIEVMARPE